MDNTCIKRTCIKRFVSVMAAAQKTRLLICAIAALLSVDDGLDGEYYFPKYPVSLFSYGHSMTATSLPALAPSYRLNDVWSVQHARAEDLPEVVTIYNQSIAGKQATAQLTPVTCEERAAWFAEHINSPTRPIYVVRARAQSMEQASEDTAQTVQAVQTNQKTAPIVAWGSFSDLYARMAYHISTEISIYLHQDYQAKGLGSLLTRWMLTQAPSLGIHNVVALIFAHNQPSLGLFGKLGFEQWGYMPKVCDMDGFIADVVMLGKAVTSEGTSNK